MTSQSLEMMLATLNMIDESLEVEVDPAALMGDIRDKVDAIKAVMDRLKAYAEFCDAQAAPYLKAAKAAENNAERIKKYVSHSMQAQNFLKLPGDKWRIQLQETAENLELDRNPSPEDVIKYPELVEVERSYKWKKAAIKAWLNLGNNLDFARLKRSSYAKFYLNKDTKAIKELGND